MFGIAFGAVDIAILLIVALLAVLALRSIVKGDALYCSTCNGDCSGCGGTCKNPQIKLSKQQLQELDELDRKYWVSR